MSQSTETVFLESSLKLFRYYKKLGEGAISQLTDEQLNTRPNDSSNSIALIVRHLSGNMMSRWTDFLNSDGEKPWRDRDGEFDNGYPDRALLMADWEKGWSCLFNAFGQLKPDDVDKIIYIRNEGHTVMEAIQRQLAHYPHHVGQIIYQAKVLKGEAFKSLSIPRGHSNDFNSEKFSIGPGVRHFTEGMK